MMKNINELISEAQAAYHSEQFEAAEKQALQALELSANNLEAMTILGGVELWRQNFEAASAWFARIVEASPNDHGYINNLLLALSGLKNQKWACGDVSGSLKVTRQMLSHNIEDSDARSSLVTFLALTKEKARLSDYVLPDVLDSVKTKILFIACFPKSGSTWLNQLFQEITGFGLGLGIEYYSDNEQDISYRRIAEAARSNCVVQQHTRATQANVQIMQGFGIRPVIQVRNLFDMVFSVHDFMFKHGARGSIFGFSEQFGVFDEIRRLDFIVDMVMPWYIGFYVSWFNAERRGDLELHWLRYEDLVSQPKETLRRAMDFFSLPVAEDVIERAIKQINGNRELTRFNKGVTGRGRSLTAAQRQRLKNQTAYFPDVDFSRIMTPEPPLADKPPARPRSNRFF